MRKEVFSVVGILACGMALAQDPTAINRTNAPSRDGGSSASRTDLGTTNSLGSQTSVEQLAAELRHLRAVVDRTMPLLSSFNQMHNSSATNDTLNLGGAISEVLGALSKDKNRDSGVNQREVSSTSNVVSVLGGLLKTNSAGLSSVDAEMLRNLATLERRLQPVNDVLKAMNVSPGDGSAGSERLTPTGRGQGDRWDR